MRQTKKQLVLDNGDKFWKHNGHKVGDISATKATIYPLSHYIVSELYNDNIDVYTIIEWLYQLKQLVLSKQNIDIDDIKKRFEELYDIIIHFEDYES